MAQLFGGTGRVCTEHRLQATAYSVRHGDDEDEAEDDDCKE